MNSKIVFITTVVLITLCQIECRLLRLEEEDVSSKPITCGPTQINRLDENLWKISTFADLNRDYPKNRDELTPYCSENRRRITWSLNYTRTCLKETSKHVTSLGVHSIKSIIKKYCYSGSKTKDAFISWSRCGNAAKPATVKCWRTYITRMLSIEFSVNHKHKIPLMCCSHHRFAACNQNAYEDLGSKICPEKSIDGLQDLLNTSMFDVIKYLCGEYETDDNDRCTAMLKNLPKVEVRNPLPLAPLTTSIRILDSLPND